MICLTMIVKDEAHVISRAISSALPWINCWYIQDTGSSDNTMEVATAVLSERNGLYERHPWVDFAYNRTLALRRAEAYHNLGHDDYHLILDADDVIDWAHGPLPPWPNTEQDAWSLIVHQGNIRFNRTHVLRADGGWRWRCPVHEYMHRDGWARIGYPSNPQYISLGGGARSLDPNKAAKDADVLLKAISSCSPEDYDLLPRMTFYLAQSYRDSGQKELAGKTYASRFNMLQGYHQERYVACLEMAKIEENYRIFWYKRAFSVDPKRIEAPFWIAKHYANMAIPDPEALPWAAYAASLQRHPDALFEEKEVYNWASNLFKHLLGRAESWESGLYPRT